MNPTYIYGAGKYGVLTALDCERKGVNIAGFIDRDAEKIKTRLGLPVLDPIQLNSANSKSKIIIAITKQEYIEDIIETLLSIGLRKDIDFEAPYLKKKEYDKSFYDNQSSLSISSARKIIPYISKLFPKINSIIDIGCGIGTWLCEWKSFGKKVLGIDGNDIPKTFILDEEYLKCDLEKALPKLDSKFDLCMSLEVAEHLTQGRSESFIKELCGFSDIVLFSAAIPGQTGVNHINEQWQSYWAKIFENNGYKAYDILRHHFWDEEEVAWWYSQNMIIYAKNSLNIPTSSQTVVFDIVHPKCLEMYYRN